MKTNVSKYGSSSYIPASHVKYLESAGARIVPVEHTISTFKMKKTLEQLNGIYIPGDSYEALLDKEYMSAVKEIIGWT